MMAKRNALVPVATQLRQLRRLIEKDQDEDGACPGCHDGHLQIVLFDDPDHQPTEAKRRAAIPVCPVCGLTNGDYGGINSIQFCRAAPRPEEVLDQ
jgi:hypothetical protein